jgi:hypothetical protein
MERALIRMRRGFLEAGRHQMFMMSMGFHENGIGFFLTPGGSLC